MKQSNSNSNSKNFSISVVIPSRNPGPEIRETLKSLERQTVPPKEIIIFDNKSIKSIREVYLMDSEISLPQLKIFRGSKERNMGESWTKACEYSTCEWTLLLPSDDVLHPSAIEVFTKYVDSDSNTKMIVGNLDLLVRGNRIIRKRRKLTGHIQNTDLLNLVMNSGINVIGATACVLFNTNYLKQSLPWNSKYTYLTDLDMYIRLARSGGTCLFLKERVAFFRIHSDSLTGKLGFSKFEQAREFWKSNFPEQKIINYRIAMTRVYLRTIIREVFQKLVK